MLSPSIADLVPDYEAFIRNEGRRAGGVKRYVDNIYLFVRTLPANAGPEAFTEYNIVECMHSPLVAKWSAGTRQNLWSSLKSFGDYLVHKGYIGGNPLANMKYPRRRPREILPWLRTYQIRQFLDVLDSPPPYLTAHQLFHWRRNRRVMLVMLYAGLRRNEVVHLTYGDIALAEGVLIVPGPGSRHGNGRPIGLHDRLKNEFCDAEKYHPATPVICTQNNDPPSPGLIDHMFDRWLPKLDLPFSINAHTLRRTFGTQLRYKGVHLRVIQELLGHESLKTTERYLGFEPSELIDGVNRLPKNW